VDAGHAATVTTNPYKEQWTVSLMPMQVTEFLRVALIDAEGNTFPGLFFGRFVTQ